MNYMTFGEQQIPVLRICMGMFAVCSLLIGVTMSLEGQVSLALTNLCGASFFIFAYFNPDALETRRFPDARVSKQHGIETSFEKVVQKKFLWTSLAIGGLAVLLEFREYLPLG
ncbi:MAG: hypothetical protein V2J89_07490 [Halieaceae bacterium]|jgi:hypothetical protein|nr:hypothetical protein [Halieaceae bacterium]